MNPTSLLVALVTVLFLAGSPQASEKPAKEPAGSPKATTKEPAPDISKPPVKKVVAGGATLPVKKKPAPDTSKPPVKKVVAGGAAPPVKKERGAPGAKGEFASILERCDENGDQAVTLAEFQKNQPAGKDAAAVEKWFQTRDSNRDGQLSKEDFKPATSKKSSGQTVLPPSRR